MFPTEELQIINIVYLLIKLQEVELNSSPLECGQDLVTHF